MRHLIPALLATALVVALVTAVAVLTVSKPLWHYDSSYDVKTGAAQHFNIACVYAGNDLCRGDLDSKRTSYIEGGALVALVLVSSAGVLALKRPYLGDRNS